MADNKQSFVLYHDIREPVEMLTDEERGKLFSAILNYSEYGEQPAFSGALQMAFAFIRTALDRDAEKWEDKRQKRIESGRLGGIKSGEARKQHEAIEANASKPKQTKQSQANEAVPVPIPAPVPAPVPAIENKAGKPQRFSPPSVDEVREYCEALGFRMDAQAFHDHFSSNGWKVGGRAPMKDWRAAARNWERRQKDGFGRNNPEHVPEQSRKQFTGLYDIE